MLSSLLTVGFVAGLAALVWVTYQYEPHWSSKDGRRFTCRVRALQTDQRLQAEARMHLDQRLTISSLLGGGGGGRSGPGAVAARWRDARATVDDGALLLVARVGPLRRPLGPVRVLARGDAPVRRRWVYVVETTPLRELRVPVRSRAVPHLDQLVARTSGSRPTA